MPPTPSIKTGILFASQYSYFPLLQFSSITILFSCQAAGWIKSKNVAADTAINSSD